MSVIIRLQNLPLAANASDVRSFFKGLSIPDGGVHIVGGALGDAFIAFSTDEDARQAMALNGGFIKNGPVSLLLSSRAEMQKVIDQARKAALAYMQLKQAAAAAPAPAVATVPQVALPQTTNASLPTALIAGIHQPVNPSLAGLSSTAKATAAAAAVQQPQPPVISLAGFLAKASAGQLNNAAPTPTTAPVTTSFSPLRSRSVSRDRVYRISSRSSSRERGGGRRRSRSSSRDRRQKRDGKSRSSSRERTSRWSRSSSREYGRNRPRSSRSRSSSRDRFGRTRQRSRSRSRDRRSRDSTSRDRYDGTSNGGGRSNRVSRFSDRATSDFVGQQQSQQSAMNSVFATGMNHAVEPIYGLHTIPGGMEGSHGRFGSNQAGHFSTVSGKISPSPFGNGMMNGGSVFRMTSPLPDSVYSGGSMKPNSGLSTSDFAVKLSNFELSTGYGDFRRFFRSAKISTQGIKMINDQHGRRTGIAYIQFLNKEGKQSALLRDGTIMRRNRVRIESITDQEFESAVDSFRPGSETKSQDASGWRDGRTVNPWDMSHEDPRGGGGGSDDANERHRNQPSGNDAAGGHVSTLTVWNLPSFTTEQDILKMFSDFTVVEVLIVRNHYSPKQMDGYVKFHRPEDAREAWSQLHRHYIGNKKVTVRACEEIDYEVAKNEYENPGLVEDDGSGTEHRNTNGQNEQDSGPANNSDSENMNGNNSNGRNGNGRQGRASKQGTRWGSVERNLDDQMDMAAAAASSMNFMDGQQLLDGDSSRPNSEANNSWNNRDPRRLRDDDSGDNGDDSNSNFGNNANMNHGNNSVQHSRDPRKLHNRFGGGGGNSSGDNSEMFKRTNWLLLRNVDFHVYEEDVYAFFGNDGFQAKTVLLVRNERGGRTGECLVEFGSPSEAHHAESKSSQNLGRRKVFASHLDRGQVADLMARFNAIAQGTQPSYWLPDHLQNDNNGNSNGGQDQSDDDDPEKNQGVGCGPYRTSTVGLLNLAYKTTVEDVQHFFQEFNLPPENIRRRFLDNGQPTGEAMVRFQNHHDAEKALNEYQNRRLFGRNVRIRLINDD
uniref:RRM domain-containing protein n=1 Tax=Anopheles stephensi TaxID=30069 RepID=A0A182YMM2_ANOST